MPCRWPSKGSNPDSKSCADEYITPTSYIHCTWILVIQLCFLHSATELCSTWFGMSETRSSQDLKESLENVPVRPSSNLRRLILGTLRVAPNGNIDSQLRFPLLTHTSINSLLSHNEIGSGSFDGLKGLSLACSLYNGINNLPSKHLSTPGHRVSLSSNCLFSASWTFAFI